MMRSFAGQVPNEILENPMQKIALTSNKLSICCPPQAVRLARLDIITISLLYDCLPLLFKASVMQLSLNYDEKFCR